MASPRLLIALALLVAGFLHSPARGQNLLCIPLGPGNAYERMGRLEEAIREPRAALQAEPGPPSFRRAEAQTLLATREAGAREGGHR